MVYIKLYIIHPQHSAHDLEDPGFSNTNCTNLGVSKNRGTPKTPQNDHFLVGKPMKTNGCWVPPFLETSISCLVCLSRTFFSRRGAFPREPRSEVEWLSDVAIAVGSRLNAMINLMATKINGGLSQRRDTISDESSRVVEVDFSKPTSFLPWIC